MMPQVQFGQTRLFAPTQRDATPESIMADAEWAASQMNNGLAISGDYINAPNVAYMSTGDTDTFVAKALIKAIDENTQENRPTVVNALKNLLGTYLGQPHHFGSPDLNLPLFPRPGQQPSPNVGMIGMDPWPFKLNSPPFNPSKAQVKFLED